MHFDFDVPQSLQKLVIYLRFANELCNFRIVKYYTLLFTLCKGIEINSNLDDEESKLFLKKLVLDIEEFKNTISSYPEVLDSDVGSQYVLEFCLLVFKLAHDRDNYQQFGIVVYKNTTIRLFLAAGLLFDVLSIFGFKDAKIDACRKYAKWKALYLSECLKNGENPIPGPLKKEHILENIINESSTSEDSPVKFPIAAPYKWIPQCQIDRPMKKEVAQLDEKGLFQAKRLAEIARTAMQYEDRSTAVEYVTRCLKLLKYGSEASQTI